MSPAPGCFVGIDMGTTNTRAWLVQGEEIVDTARAAFGVRDSAMSGSAAGVASVVGGLVAELRDRHPASQPELLLAAGMITSPLGLREVPHVPAPAGPAELAGGLVRARFDEVGALEVWLVPGVRTGPPRLAVAEIGAADVMRGEETLCLGLLEAGVLRAGEALWSLGSHWKVVRTDASGRVAGSSTSLAGELLHAVQSHTVLAASLPQERPREIDGSWFRAGAAQARRSGLTRALFAVRLLEQRTEGDAVQRQSYLLGAVVEAELEAMRRGRGLEEPLLLAGGEALSAAVGQALAERGVEGRVLSPGEVERAMVRGLRRVADEFERTR